MADEQCVSLQVVEVQEEAVRRYLNARASGLGCRVQGLGFRVSQDPGVPWTYTLNPELRTLGTYGKK